ncbi:MAG: efflux RND transporter periplasmic adaptor subunit [Opitutaceae bacterium]|nr:efflux RND transporter periplasmic adaptor subunit [Opitutaceae bacterium]
MPSKPFPWVKILVLLALAALGVFAYLRFQKKQQSTPEVATVKPSRGEIVQGVTATGVLEAPVTVDVSSQISGQIREVLVDFNSPVAQGDVLARIDPATYESRLRQARAQLGNAEASFTLARLNTERIRELHTKNLVSQQERDQAEAQLTQAEANLKIQQANVVNAEVDLSRCTIYAPIDGIVLDRQCDVGKMVAASFNAPTLFTLVTDLTTLQISADVSEADVGTVTVGQEVSFTVDAYPQRPFFGTVKQIRNVPKTSQSVVVYATIIDVKNDELKLKPGMTANVTIVVAKRANALRIPNAALRARIADAFKPVAASDSPSAPQGASEPPSGQSTTSRARPEGARQAEGPGTRPAGAHRQRMRDGPRTVYRLVSALPNLKLEAVQVKVGITDGTFTEVLDGLKDEDTLVSSVFLPNDPATPAASPFSGAPGAPGGGGRRF